MSEAEPRPDKPDGEPPHAETSKDDRQMAMFAHLSGILAAIVTGTFGGFIGPLIIWLINKDKSEFVVDQAKEALNFQITILVVYLAAWGLTGVSCFLLAPVLAVPFLLQIIFGIVGGMKANEGERYRYPFNIRLVT